MALRRGFGVGGAVSSVSSEDDDGSELPAAITTATRESRICCGSSLLEMEFVESRLLESGFAESGFGESRGARVAGSGPGAVDATFIGNCTEGIESGAAGVASG